MSNNSIYNINNDFLRYQEIIQDLAIKKPELTIWPNQESTIHPVILDLLKNPSTTSSSGNVLTGEEFLKTHELNDDNMKKFFFMMRDKYIYNVEESEMDLKRWCADIRAQKRRWPNRNDYDSKRREIIKMFHKDYPNYPVDNYFEQGADDTADAGALLLSLGKGYFNEDLKNATVLLCNIQWLIRKRDALPYDSEVDFQEKPLDEKHEETQENALKLLLTKYLGIKSGQRNIQINGNSRNKTRVLIAVMHVLETNGVLPANNVNDYSMLLEKVLNEKSENIRKKISGMQQEIIKYGLNLKDLNEDYIKKNKIDDDKSVIYQQFRDTWEGIYEYIDSLIKKNEDLEILRGKV